MYLNVPASEVWRSPHENRIAPSASPSRKDKRDCNRGLYYSMVIHTPRISASRVVLSSFDPINSVQVSPLAHLEGDLDRQIR
jgi:hypothetical protein